MENNSIRLQISLSERETAIQNGARFIRGDFFKEEKSFWEIPKEKEDKRIKESILLQFEEQSVIQKKEEEDTLFSTWQVLLQNGCTLDIARACKEIGIPSDVSQRIKMLQILNTVDKEQFPITWENLIVYSDSFNEKYGWAAYESLAEKYDLGKKDYFIEIEEKPLTEEEKWFIRYMLPI